MRCLRALTTLSMLLAVAACADSEPGSSSNVPVVAGLPQFLTGLPDAGPEFAVSGLAQAPTQPGYAGFNNGSPDAAARHAALICTQGYQRLDEGTAPGEPVPFALWRVRCQAYRPSL